MQEDYAHEYAVFKPDKRLQWMPHLGTVQLELELEDRTIEAEVPPLEAAFIELFSERRTALPLVHVSLLIIFRLQRHGPWMTSLPQWAPLTAPQPSKHSRLGSI